MNWIPKAERSGADVGVWAMLVVLPPGSRSHCPGGDGDSGLFCADLPGGFADRRRARCLVGTTLPLAVHPLTVSACLKGARWDRISAGLLRFQVLFGSVVVPF